jgi:hypothetical protein
MVVFPQSHRRHQAQLGPLAIRSADEACVAIHRTPVAGSSNVGLGPRATGTSAASLSGWHTRLAFALQYLIVSSDSIVLNRRSTRAKLPISRVVLFSTGMSSKQFSETVVGGAVAPRRSSAGKRCVALATESGAMKCTFGRGHARPNDSATASHRPRLLACHQTDRKRPEIRRRVRANALMFNTP